MIVQTILICSCSQNPTGKNQVSDDNIAQLTDNHTNDTGKHSVSFELTNEYLQIYDPKKEETWNERYNKAYKNYIINDMPYRLMRPINFDTDKKYPVFVTLHGGGALTSEFSMLSFFNYILFKEDNRKKYPAYVLAPGTDAWFNETHLNNVKDIISNLPSVDMNRIYIYGHSLGGHGTFNFLWNDSSFFAAAVTSASYINANSEEVKEFALKIKDIPIWAFQGDMDTICPFNLAQRAFEEMENIGVNIKFSTLKGVGHSDIEKEMMRQGDNLTTQFSSNKCDREADLLKWIFSQRKEKLK